MKLTLSSSDFSSETSSQATGSKAVANRKPSFKLSFFVAVVAVIVLLATSCSSDDNDTSSVVTDPVASDPVPSTTAPAEEAPVVPTTTASATTVSETESETASSETGNPASSQTSQPPAEEPDVGGSDSNSAPTAFAPGNLSYPDPLPDAPPGTLIDVEPLGEFGEVSAYRILYHSRTRTDENIAVSGYVIAPLDDASDVEWPVVAYAHGTVGMADQCAPSATLHNDLRRADAESSIVAQFARQGYVVVATDYEGLGTPGLHPYLVGESAARSILDSVRAVQQMEWPNVSNSFAVAGISQGGHAALQAGQYWQGYAPELDLVGVVSMAPPSQATLLYDAIINTNSKGFIYMALAAYDVSYEEVDATEVLTPKGLELLAELEKGCTDYVFNVFNSHEVSDLISVDNPLAIPAWRDIALENDVNQRALPVPVFIVHGGADTLIPAVSSALLCAQITPLPGQGPTLRKVYEGASHGGVAIAATPDITTWLKARFANQEATETGCG